ncbi:MAG: Stk1 family PASTA domain-containing Ser/Thr kinase [Candidatus Syntrophonatronum acetioxidans]|uniref:non-specific serine/threonine protein kinase n=1 Tax=Candidatus Syntrophonatronum acetioxidans TaxID=1795816 RepID=A0A424YHT7_9FIRM|nr:MAG: Stk1 family PASTA domain-containing Ser/Thr kinase [Candidatus Syntrophonatronum acetioxidans]
MIGKTLASRYKIEEKIGDGGMAVVYKGRDMLLNRTVTLKVLRSQFITDENFVRRFHREAQAAASLSHQNVVNIYDVGEEDDIYYIVMEYIGGKTLKELIKEKGRLSPEEAADIARQICEALVHAHKNKIIHRDIKPHNILITYDGTVKVTDFGIAKAVTAATMTYDNNIVMGSVHYFAPEQARGGLAEEKADLYSLGIVLYEMLTGEVPFSGESPVSVALKHIQENIKSPLEINSDISPELEKIILKATQKEVTRRYQSAQEMLKDLKSFINKEKVNIDSFNKPTVNHMDTLSVPVKRIKKESMNNNKNKNKKRGSMDKWKYRWLAAGLVAFFLFVFVLAMGFNHLRAFLVVPEVEVPDVVNLSIREATSVLNEAGLEGEIVEEISHEEIPVGHVVSQDPEGGRMVKENRKVELVISTGPTYVEVPSVVDKREIEAKIILQELELVVETVEEFSEEVSPGIVMSQNPGGGSRIAPGEVVTLVVSKGAEPFSLRDFTGRTLEDVKEWIELSKLKLREVKEEHSDTVPEGKVIRQFPEAGEMVQASDPVDLVVSKGPEKKVEEAYNINVDPARWGIDEGDNIRIDINDNRGSRTSFEGVYEGTMIVVEGWGSGTVTIMKEDGQGYTTLEAVKFP